MLIDLHVHTRHTQGCALSPRDAVRRAREAGLDGVAFADLNTLDGLEEVRQAGREENFLALCGVEIATDKGHYLCFFPEPEKVPALPQIFGTPPWPVRDVLRKVRELGGAAVAAHPYDKTIDHPSGDFIFTLDGLCAIEGLNARRRGPANDLAVEAADHMNLPCTGGSGAKGSLDEIGTAATLFKEAVHSERDVVAQLRAGSVFCVAIGVSPTPPERRAERRGGPERREGADSGRRPGGHGRREHSGRGRGHRR